jgi:hypothetical protein
MMGKAIVELPRDFDASFDGLLGASPNDPVEFVVNTQSPSP